jgi:hypothetical protein
MRFSAGVVAAIAGPIAAMAFVQPSVRSRASLGQAFLSNSGLRTEQQQLQKSKALTQLQMAFELKEGQVSNMFEGPAPLVKERDACGVGFIANTSTGGEILFVCLYLCFYLSVYICVHRLKRIIFHLLNIFITHYYFKLFLFFLQINVSKMSLEPTKYSKKLL